MQTFRVCTWILFLAQLHSFAGSTGVQDANLTLKRQRDDGVALAVDVDGAIWTVLVRDNKRNERDVTYLSNLGYAVQRSGALDLRQLVPPEEVVVSARRRTKGFTTFHVLVSWALPNEGLPGYRIYVLREDTRRHKVRTIYVSEPIPDTFYGVALRDIDGDGTVEVVDVGRTEKVTVFTLRSIKDDRVNLVQQIEADQVHVEWGAFLIGEPSVWTGNIDRATMSNQRQSFSVQWYGWSKDFKKFVPTK
jgi:hypothetical protein